MAEYFAQLKLQFSHRTLLIVKISLQMVCYDHAIIVSSLFNSVQCIFPHLIQAHQSHRSAQCLFPIISPKTASNSDLRPCVFYGISDKLLPHNQKQTLY